MPLFECTTCGEELTSIPIVSDTKGKSNDFKIGVRPCSNCITAKANIMANNFRDNLLHRLNAASDGVAEEIKGEVHQKLIHTFTTEINKAKKESDK
jgi:hypothetical protein